MAKLSNSFSDIAHIYHRFNNNHVYDQWLAFTLRHLETYPKQLLDLGCGNGEFTSRMADFADHIIGLDYDPAMIQMAKAINASSPNIHYVVGNMLEASHYGNQLDLVTCYLDALCFLTSQADLITVFDQVRQSLSLGGIFLFDVWSVNQVKEFDGYYYYDLDEDAALLWESHSIEASSPEAEAIRHDITVFEVEEGTGLYQRIQTSLVETTYSLESYCNLLVQAGFSLEKISIYPDFAHDPLYTRIFTGAEPEAERWFFKVVK